MLRNLQTQDCSGGESEEVNRLDSDNPRMALRKDAEQLVMDPLKALIPTVEDCISKVGVHSVQQLIKPIMDDWIQKVQAEIQLAVEKKLVCENWNSTDETATRIPRYKMTFSDEVSDPVYTGKEIKGKEGTDIKVFVVDNETGDLVDSGPVSSAKLEILPLDADVEDFNNSIITEKNKPHFHKPVYVNLKKGIGIFPKNVKLRHISKWTTRCKCRLGARVVQQFDGSRIKEASTESFTVLDRRSSLYKKHDQPSLSDEVWRLKNISKNGAPHNRLRENNISTVREFLSLLSVDPQRLKKIFGAGRQKWQDTVDQALQCYTKICSSPEREHSVAFDVGQQEGVLPDDSCVPIESVAKDENEKNDAWKNEAPAFENRNNMAASNDDASFLCDLPSTSNDKNAANSTVPDGHRTYDAFDEENAGQYLENAEISNELPDNVSKSFSDPFPLWNFDDGRELSM